MPSDQSNDQPTRVLLVCHAGAALGIGHLTRSLAVAEALKQAGSCEVRLLIQGEPLDRADLSDVECEFISVDESLLDRVDAVSTAFDPTVVVFDLHPKLIPSDFDARATDIGERGTHLIGVDSLLGHCRSLDVTWVPSLLVDAADLADCDGNVQWGWDSLLIGGRRPLRTWSYGDRVLVLSGGSDVTHQNVTLPELLDRALPEHARIDWVQGPFADPPVLPPEPRHNWTIHEAPSGLNDVIETADYGLTVFGVTLFELLRCGLPSVAFSPYDDRKFPELDVVAGAGAAVVAPDASQAVRELAALMMDPHRAQEMSATALELMQVNGAERLADLIHSLAS
jgi:spore coat polysaccharide biosynthesis predicted glycosyltransferase SpsG